MSLEIQTIALMTAAFGAMARFPAVAYAWLRTLLVRRRFVSFRFGWVEFLTNFEPPLALIIGYLLFRTLGPTSAPALWRTLAGTIGGGFVLAGWAFQIWAFLSWTSLYAGHGVVDDQHLIRHGAYAVVRHPAYFGVCAVWVGLGVAFTSTIVLAIACLYVIPIYVLYLRAEESLMLEAFGSEYRDYRRSVPMLVPRPGSTR